MAHLHNLDYGIKDVSNDGYDHDKKFKETADTHSLAISRHRPYGWTATDLMPETAAWIARQPELCDIAARPPSGSRAGAKARGEDDGETATTAKGRRSASKGCSIWYICPKAGAILRVTRLVNVVCGDCSEPFEIAR